MYGGIRLTGRINNWDIGFLDAQIAGNDSIPTENFGVVRIRKRVFNQNSFVGSLLTSTVDADGNYNVNYGLDALGAVEGDDVTLSVQDSNSSGLIRQPGNDDCTFVVMPMRL